MLHRNSSSAAFQTESDRWFLMDINLVKGKQELFQSGELQKNNVKLYPG